MYKINLNCDLGEGAAFDGKIIALPQVRKNYPFEGVVEWHRKEFFRG